jgi:hypothetical protein
MGQKAPFLFELMVFFTDDEGNNNKKSKQTW